MNDTTINDGGSAFPCFPPKQVSPNCFEMGEDAGMSLRDYFAAKALQGYLASMTDSAEMVQFGRPEKVAMSVWLYADAMIATRNNKTL